MIELMVVLVLMSLIFAGVMLKLGGPLFNAKLEYAKSSLVNFDRRARELCRRRKQEHVLHVDIVDGAFAFHEKHGDGDPIMRLKLPDGVRLAGIRVDDVWRETGSVDLKVNASGEAPSFSREDGGPRRST